MGRDDETRRNKLPLVAVLTAASVIAGVAVAWGSIVTTQSIHTQEIAQLAQSVQQLAQAERADMAKMAQADEQLDHHLTQLIGELQGKGEIPNNGNN